MIHFGEHLVLVLRLLHADEMKDTFKEKIMNLGDHILYMYVMFLFSKQHEELAGIYASQLARHRCIDLFGFVSMAGVFRKLGGQSEPVARSFLNEGLRVDRMHSLYWYNRGLLLRD
ncbi:putative nuclear pore protein [Helianthus anomalus]